MWFALLSAVLLELVTTALKTKESDNKEMSSLQRMFTGLRVSSVHCSRLSKQNKTAEITKSGGTEWRKRQQGQRNFTYVFVYAALRGQICCDLFLNFTYAAFDIWTHERCSMRLLAPDNRLIRSLGSIGLKRWKHILCSQVFTLAHVEIMIRFRILVHCEQASECLQHNVLLPGCVRSD